MSQARHSAQAGVRKLVAALGLVGLLPLALVRPGEAQELVSFPTSDGGVV